MRLPRVPVDVRDLHAYGGLVLAAVGGWQLSPPWTCVFVGAVLLGMGLFLRKAVP